jgi:hypothetical protein
MLYIIYEMIFPHELFYLLIDYCNIEILLNLRQSNHLLKTLTHNKLYTLLINRFEDNKHKKAQLEVDFHTFSPYCITQLYRYKEFINYNPSDLSEASWYNKPVSELELVCYLLCLLFGEHDHSWNYIRTVMKKYTFRNWYKKLISDEIQISDADLFLLDDILNKMDINFIRTIRIKSKVGHRLYVNLYSIIQIHVLRHQLDELSTQLIVSRIKMINLSKILSML